MRIPDDVHLFLAACSQSKDLGGWQPANVPCRTSSALRLTERCCLVSLFHSGREEPHPCVVSRLPATPFRTSHFTTNRARLSESSCPLASAESSYAFTSRTR